MNEAMQECLTLEVVAPLRAKELQLCSTALPCFAAFQKGSKFTVNALNAWSYDYHIAHIFTNQSHHVQNGYIKSLMKNFEMNAETKLA